MRALLEQPVRTPGRHKDTAMFAIFLMKKGRKEHFTLEIGHGVCSMANTWMLERALRKERIIRSRNNPTERYNNQELVERILFPQETITSYSAHIYVSMFKNTK